MGKTYSSTGSGLINSLRGTSQTLDNYKRFKKDNIKYFYAFKNKHNISFQNLMQQVIKGNLKNSFLKTSKDFYKVMHQVKICSSDEVITPPFRIFFYFFQNLEDHYETGSFNSVEEAKTFFKTTKIDLRDLLIFPSNSAEYIQEVAPATQFKYLHIYLISFDKYIILKNLYEFFIAIYLFTAYKSFKRFYVDDNHYYGEFYFVKQNYAWYPGAAVPLIKCDNQDLSLVKEDINKLLKPLSEYFSIHLDSVVNKLNEQLYDYKFIGLSCPIDYPYITKPEVLKQVQDINTRAADGFTEKFYKEHSDNLLPTVEDTYYYASIVGIRLCAWAQHSKNGYYYAYDGQDVRHFLENYGFPYLTAGTIKEYSDYDFDLNIVRDWLKAFTPELKKTFNKKDIYFYKIFKYIFVDMPATPQEEDFLRGRINSFIHFCRSSWRKDKAYVTYKWWYCVPQGIEVFPLNQWYPTDRGLYDTTPLRQYQRKNLPKNLFTLKNSRGEYMLRHDSSDHICYSYTGHIPSNFTHLYIRLPGKPDEFVSIPVVYSSRDALPVFPLTDLPEEKISQVIPVGYQLAYPYQLPDLNKTTATIKRQISLFYQTTKEVHVSSWKQFTNDLKGAVVALGLNFTLGALSGVLNQALVKGLTPAIVKDLAVKFVIPKVAEQLGKKVFSGSSGVIAYYVANMLYSASTAGSFEKISFDSIKATDIFSIKNSINTLISLSEIYNEYVQNKILKENAKTAKELEEYDKKSEEVSTKLKELYSDDERIKQLFMFMTPEEFFNITLPTLSDNVELSLKAIPEFSKDTIKTY